MFPYYQMRPEKIFGFTSSNPDFPPHMHIHLELFYVLDGKLKIMVNHQTKIMSKGDLAIVFPNCIHSRENVRPDLPITVAVVAAKPEMAGDFSNVVLNSVPENPFLSSDMVSDEATEMIFQLLKLCSDDCKSEYKPILIKSYIQIILGLETPYLSLVKNTLKEYTLIQKSLKYILNNFDQPLLSLDSVSENVGATKNHISAIFSQKLGIGFNQYLNSIRLNYAQDLMRNTDQTITEIAFTCGFGTLRTFNRVFKKYLHMTPSQFRNPG